MDHNSKSAIETVAISAAISVPITCALYFIFVVWWVGLVEVWHTEEMARHENCYQRWAYNEAHRLHYLVENYCGEKGVKSIKEGTDND